MSDKEEVIEEIIEEKIKEEINQRIEKQIEERVEDSLVEKKLQNNSINDEKVSRREFLKKVGAAGIGAGALAFLPSASAFNIRTSNPLNYYGDNQDSPNFSVSSSGTVQAESVDVNSVSDKRHYAGSYNGSSADERLDNALSNANTGDIIVLENESYTKNRTLSTAITITGGLNRGDATFDADLTFDSRINLKAVSLSDTATLTVNTYDCHVSRIYAGTGTSITVSDNRFIYIGNRGGDITFQDSTFGGIVDSCSATTVTDNDGRNTVGNIA